MFGGPSLLYTNHWLNTLYLRVPDNESLAYDVHKSVVLIIIVLTELTEVANILPA